MNDVITDPLKVLSLLSQGNYIRINDIEYIMNKEFDVLVRGRKAGICKEAFISFDMTIGQFLRLCSQNKVEYLESRYGPWYKVV